MIIKIGMVQRPQLVCLILSAALCCASYAADGWRQGTLVSVEVHDTQNKSGLLVWHHYVYHLKASELTYTVEFEHQLKASLKDTVRFKTHKEHLIVLDSDGKQRTGEIESSERN